MKWDDLRYFTAVARAGSLTGAAALLRVDASTVGRHVEALERALALQLFVRRRDGYSLNAAGERLLRHARALEAEIDALHRTVVAEERLPSGTVTVTSAESMGECFLLRHLPALCARHPGLRIDLVIDSRSFDLTRREADVALRLARPTQADLKARRLGVLGYGLYASPAYLAARGQPRRVEDLRSHLVIDWTGDFGQVAPVAWWRQVTAGAQTAIRTNPAGARLRAAEAGMGVALAPCVMAADRARLVRLLPAVAIPALDIWLLAHRDTAGLARVRAVLDFLHEQAQLDASRLRGETPPTPRRLPRKPVEGGAGNGRAGGTSRGRWCPRGGLE